MKGGARRVQRRRAIRESFSPEHHSRAFLHLTARIRKEQLEFEDVEMFEFASQQKGREVLNASGTTCSYVMRVDNFFGQ